MADFIFGENLFHFYVNHHSLERDEPELHDPDVITPVEVNFTSEVHRYVFDHSSSDIISSNLVPFETNTKTARCRFQDFRKLSSSNALLSAYLSTVNPSITPDLHDKIVNEIVTEVERYSFPELNKLLTVEVKISEHVRDHCMCWKCTAIRESELMAERETEKLRVRASESSIKKLLKRVKVLAASSELKEDHEDRQRKRRRTSSGSKSGTVRPSDIDDCTICSDEFTAGMYAAQMPCLHSFHRPCIVKRLRLSHYCPICRYEMPVADDQEDFWPEDCVHQLVDGQEDGLNINKHLAC